jgi:hypothetical protein
MFDSWLWGINKDLKPLALLGAATVSWVIWRHRNDIVFEQKKCDKFFTGCTWVVLHKPVF